MDNKYLKGMRCLTTFLMLTLLTSNLLGTTLPALAAPGDITRVSIDSSGMQANGISFGSTISNDGRFVAFHSAANNLVAHDTNGAEDIFVHDRQTGVTTLVSVDSSGAQANDASNSPRISGDGRYVVFDSHATNLIPNDDGHYASDVFVHDRQTGETTCVSVNSSGEQGNDESFNGFISGDGLLVAFESRATNLVDGDTNGMIDVFVHNNRTGETIRVSVDSAGNQADGNSNTPGFSEDGRYLVFSSSATNLVSGDTNNARDVFVHDLQTGETKRVSVSSNGMQADHGAFIPAISGNGRYVVFGSDATNLVGGDKLGLTHVYVHDLQTGETTRVSVNSDGSQMIGRSSDASISDDGRYIAFDYADTDNYMSALFEIYVHDRQTGATVFASANLSGGHGASDQDASYAANLSADGRFVTFSSYASNLIAGDTNGVPDIFVKEVAFPPDSSPTVSSIHPLCGESGCSYPTGPSISFSVSFSETVTGVTPDDFTLTMTGGISGASVTGVSGSGEEYTVAVDTGSGNGTLRLDLIDDDSIRDAENNPLGGTGAGNGNFTKGETYIIDKSTSSPPSVTSSLRADPDPTAADMVSFTVAFSEAVSGVDPSDFSLTTTGGINGAFVANISGSDNLYTVTVATGTGDGTLRLDLIDDDSIQDELGNPLGGAGAGNGNFNTGETYTVTKSIPTAPSVTSSMRVDPNPTSADLVSFNVIFSEAVSGVDLSDFSLTTTGAVNGAFVANLSGSGNVYTVIVATGSGDGGLRLDVLDDDTIINAANIPLGGPGAGNGNFTTGEAYTLDKTAPIVTGSLRADPNPTTAASVNFTVVFSEAVSGVDPSDFSLTSTGTLSGVSITAVNGSGYMYTVTANTGSGDGTLRLDVLDNDSIVDTVGLPLGGPGAGNGNFTAGEEYSFSRTPVNVTILTETFRSNGANDGWVLESSEDSNQGGYKDANSPTLLLGDDAQNRQFRAILHFPTDYLPDNAVITRALLMLNGEAIVGANPFDSLQNIVVDIRSGAFGFIGPFPYRGLQISDFQSPASKDAVGMIENNPYAGWYWTWLDSSAFEYINRTGITQLRLRFQIDDDNDMQNDYIRFFSGDYDGLASRPRLVIEYYIQR